MRKFFVCSIKFSDFNSHKTLVLFTRRAGGAGDEVQVVAVYVPRREAGRAAGAGFAAAVLLLLLSLLPPLLTEAAAAFIVGSVVIDWDVVPVQRFHGAL